MGIKHANRIEEALRRARLEDDDLDAFLSGAASLQVLREPFFIKNLERVQGDERDAIILTIGYGKTSDERWCVLHVAKDAVSVVTTPLPEWVQPRQSTWTQTICAPTARRCSVAISRTPSPGVRISATS